MTDETENTPRPPLTPMPDPADRPLEQAAMTIAKCHAPKNADLPALMLRELRGAMAELMPCGAFRSADIRLAAQSAVLDTFFHLTAMNAVTTTKLRDGSDYTYVDRDSAIFAMKLQNQCRLTIEGMKTDNRQCERINISRDRLTLQTLKARNS